MGNHNSKEHIFLYKFLYTVCTLLVYMLGRHIPLYGIDLSAYRDVELNAQTIFLQSLSGDFNNYSIFILGMWPYMLASMLMLVYMAIKQADKTSQVSPKKVTKLMLMTALIIGAVQAYERLSAYEYRVEGDQLLFTKGIVFLEMIVGMLIVIRLCNQNQKYGLGGRMVIILVNIMDALFAMFSHHTPKEMIIPAVLGFFDIAIMLILETTEKRIAVQRVSIHNIYAEKNYIAYKLNPAGIMPVMFASAAFMLPQVVFSLIAQFNPDHMMLNQISENMVLTKPLGIIVYLSTIWVLSIVFAIIMIDPKKMSEGLLKAGDSILDVYAGKQTSRYLIGNVIRFSIYSSLILSICLGLPLVLQLYGYMDTTLAMLPSSIMMSTGIWIAFYRESKVYLNLDRYKPIV